MTDGAALHRIHVNLHVGPDSLRREVFDSGTVSFGRDADCDLPLASGFASRRQGELRFENGSWWIVNQGQNPLSLNGKRVGNRPRALTQRSVISLGDETIFEVYLHAAPEPVEVEAPGSPGAAASPAAPSPLKRTARIFVPIGIGWVLIIGLAIVLLNTPTAPQQTMAPELSAAQIERDVRRPLPQVPVDRRQARQYLLQAREMYERQDAAPDALHRTHELYRLALAYSGEPQFAEGIDQRRYLDVQQQLIDRLGDLHREGYARLRSGQYRDAESTFHRLQLAYPATTSELFRNAESQRRYASDRLGRRQRR